jgi:hypothetical protein
MRFKGLLSAVAIAVCLWALGEAPLAHEHKHTHQNLARAAFRLLNLPFDTLGGLTKQEIEDELAQGVIDEDECINVDDFGNAWEGFPNWNSHFYEAKLRVRLSGVVAGCGYGIFAVQGKHNNAAQRAATLYQMARDEYSAGDLKSAFRILGRVLHLLQDMASPAHVHDDPHAELPATSKCGGDSDDFERWGYCEGLTSDGLNTRVCEYFYDSSTTHYPGKAAISFDGCAAPVVQECLADFDSDGTSESYGVPPPGFTCRLWAALHILYEAKPQGYGPNPVGPNAGHAFVHRLANVTYDFTTFTVHLQDISPSDDPLPEVSELSKMLTGSRTSDCEGPVGGDVGICEATDANGWRIRGDFQDIGRSDVQEGSTELTIGDSNEEWWTMPTGYFKKVEGVIFRDIFIDGFVYIENAGGEGPLGFGDQDSFIPRRYGCTISETQTNPRLCSTSSPSSSRAKVLYRQLYGTHENDLDPFVNARRANHDGKTLLRIYGDVLYASAVAYGAGLIQHFLDQVAERPTAAAGGPYTGAVCQPIPFDGSQSSDPNGNVITYEWDFTDDGTFDVASATAAQPFTFTAPFTGQARLRVTDSEGLSDEATAELTITPDASKPVISKVTATPASVWPPNHKMNAVTVNVSVADACGTPTCRIVSVTSNQPTETTGPKRGEPDWVITGPLTLQVRGESAPRQDRVYTVNLSCEDETGNAVTSTTTVTVPRPPETKPVPAAPTVKKGRYKKSGGACVWDANDNGANQCAPVMGRYKIAGGRCVWDAKDRGANQCTPGKGRYKKAGGGCVWAPNDSGPNQCTPPRPR